jgi:hypothetical protein
MGRPETRANLSEGLRRGWKNYREKRLAVIRKQNSDPERRAKISVTNKARYGDSAAPDSWTSEQKHARQKISDANKDSWAKLTPQRRKRRANDQMRGFRTERAAALRGEAIKASWSQRKDELQDLRAKAWRPPDWDRKPVEWHIIGPKLLSKPYVSNVELGQGLDEDGILPCPYGKDPKLWERALSSNKATRDRAAIKRVNEIRKWVGRPGRMGRRAKVVAPVKPVKREVSSLPAQFSIPQ